MKIVISQDKKEYEVMGYHRLKNARRLQDRLNLCLYRYACDNRFADSPIILDYIEWKDVNSLMKMWSDVSPERDPTHVKVYLKPKKRKHQVLQISLVRGNPGAQACSVLTKKAFRKDYAWGTPQIKHVPYEVTL